MKDTFYFLDVTQEKIKNQMFICIWFLDLEKHTIFRIFKKYTDDDFEKYRCLEQFEDITSYITFVIKRDGKLALDINL